MDTLTTAPTLPPGTVVQVRVPLLCACGKPFAIAVYEDGALVAIDVLSRHDGETHRNRLTLSKISARIVAVPD